MRSFCKAQVDYAVYDARREKDLMEARLRGELDDAQHQQEIQQVSSLWMAYGWLMDGGNFAIFSALLLRNILA